MRCPFCEQDNRPDRPGGPVEIVLKGFGNPFAGELVVSSGHEIGSARRAGRGRGR